MKIDKMGEFWASIAYHICFIGMLIADWEAVGIGNMVVVTVMGMFFFGIRHFSETSE